MSGLIEVNMGALEELATQLRDGPARMKAASVRLLNKSLRAGVKFGTEILTAGGDYRTRVPGKLHRRSAALARSFWYRQAVVQGDTITGSIGTLKAEGGKVPVYFHAQEEGTRPIKPVRAKVLTIPLDAALTPAGVPRFTAREAEQQYPGGTFWRRVSLGGQGTLILLGVKTLGGKWGRTKLTPLFLGVKQTKGITGVHYTKRSAEETADIFRREAGDWWAKSLLSQTGTGGA
jgi:hypothetical protein